MNAARTPLRERAAGPALRIPQHLLARLVRICRNALPGKAFGMLAGPEPGVAAGIHPMTRNLRRVSPLVNRVFESYGDFYRDPDRGFCFDPVELAEAETEIRRKGWRIVGVYHSHRCRRAVPSRVDIDFHYSPEALAVIVSVADPDAPQVAVFRIRKRSYEKARLEVRSG